MAGSPTIKELKDRRDASDKRLMQAIACYTSHLQSLKKCPTQEIEARMAQSRSLLTRIKKATAKNNIGIRSLNHVALAFDMRLDFFINKAIAYHKEQQGKKSSSKQS